jgi:hypothetical protein
MGERLFDDKAEHSIRNWMSPAEIARLLLTRRAPRPIPRLYEPSGFRLLDVITPDLDDVLVMETRDPPDTGKSDPATAFAASSFSWSSHRRAGRTGPEMLHMLRGHTTGENKARFGSASDEIVACACQSVASSQLYLI